MRWSRIAATVLCAAQAVVASNILKIAVVLPVSDEPYLRDTAFKGVQLAASEINNDTDFLQNVQIDVQLFDDMGKPSEVIAQAYRIVDLGYNAVIGEEYSSMSRYLAYALSSHGIFQCSAWSTSPSLSDKTEFPTFFRVTPDDNAQGLVMLEFVRTMGWSNAAVLASSDSYAQGIADILVSSSAAYGIKLSSVLSFSTQDQDGVAAKIQRLQETGARIVFLLCADVTETLIVTRALKEAEMLGPEFVYIGGDAMASVLTAENIMAGDVDNLQGLFTTSPREYSNHTRSFEERFSAFNGSAPFQQSDCEGCASHYDALYAIAYGYKNQMTKGAPAATIVNNALFKGLNLTIADFVTYPPFEGAQQTISFTPQGDVSTANFRISNLVGDSQVDIATTAGGSALRFVAGTQPTFYGGGTDTPKDMVTLKDDVVGFRKPAAAVIIALVTAMAGLVAVSIPTLFIFRTHQILKPVSPEFMAIAALGMLICLGSIYVDSVETPTETSCNAQIALLAVGFGNVVGSILVKLVRLYRIFDNRIAGRQMLNTQKLLLGSGAIIAGELLLIIIWWSAFPLQAIERQDILNQRRYYECQSNNSKGQLALSTLMFLYNAALVCACCYLAFSTRNIYSAFNEAKAIGVAIYNILFCVIIVLLISYMGSSTSMFLLWTVRTVVILFAVVVTYSAVIGRFLWALLLKKDPATYGLKNGSQSGSMGNATNTRSVARALNNINNSGKDLGSGSRTQPRKPAKPITASVKTTVLHVRGASSITTSQWRKFNVSLIAHPVSLLILIKDKDPSKTLALPIAGMSATIEGKGIFKIAYPKGALDFQTETDMDASEWVAIIDTVRASNGETSQASKPKEEQKEVHGDYKIVETIADDDNV
ncbi:periplasmic binding protein-like I [Powellomyces hirtus]|nr:periplasmic binding protein-like I [Powellomyces hirtus]